MTGNPPAGDGDGDTSGRDAAEIRARLRPLPVPTQGRAEIVYLDPVRERPASQYSPEGEIRMMGEFAAGLARRNSVSRPMIYGLIAIMLLPILVTVIAVVSTWV